MQLSSVEMDRLVNSTMTAVETANYIYYGGVNGTTFGRVGDLEQVAVNEFESGIGGTVSVPINYDLYRYDPTTSLLLYAVEGNAYERYSANVSNPLTDNSGAIAQYANEAFTYFGAGSGSQSGKVMTDTPRWRVITTIPMPMPPTLELPRI